MAVTDNYISATAHVKFNIHVCFRCDTLIQHPPLELRQTAIIILPEPRDGVEIPQADATISGCCLTIGPHAPLSPTAPWRFTDSILLDIGDSKQTQVSFMLIIRRPLSEYYYHMRHRCQSFYLSEPCDHLQNCDIFQLLPLLFQHVALQSALLI